MFSAHAQSPDSDRQISRIGDCSGGSQDDDDDDDDATLNNTVKTKLKKSAYGCARHFSKAKKVVLLPFTNRKRHHLTPQPWHTNPKSPPPPPPPPPSGKKVFHSCFCFKQPSTLESSSPSPQSQTSDPNHPNFTSDMLKTLIERNDFHSKECNPHLDASYLPSSKSQSSPYSYPV